MKKYGEHVDDHQLQLVGQFKELNLIYACDEGMELEKALKIVKINDYKTYESNTQTIIKSLEDFING